MTQDQYNLILKVLSGNATGQEKQEVDDWRKASADHESLYQDTKTFWDKLGEAKKEYLPDPEKAWNEFRKRLGSTPKRKPPLLRMAAVLALVLGIGALVAILMKPKEVINDSGEKYSEQRKIQKHYSTDKDSVLEITLPDSSMILLSGNSQLTSFEDEKGKAGQLNLDGTAYFELLSSKHGYAIATNNLMLGTSGASFSIHEDEEKGSTEVSVENGQVSVYPKHHRKEKISVGAKETYVYDAHTKTFKVEETKHQHSWWKRFMGRLKRMMERMKKHKHND